MKRLLFLALILVITLLAFTSCDETQSIHYKLDSSDIKSELIEELEDSYVPGTEVTVVIGTVTETNQYLWVNDEKLIPTDSNLMHTTFTFVMPDRDVKLRIEQKSVDIPLSPSDDITYFSKIDKVDSLPKKEESAMGRGQTADWTSQFFQFEYGLEYFRYDNDTDTYYKGSLTLPSGYDDGTIRSFRQMESADEMEIIIHATNKNGKKVYLGYIFDAPDDPLNSQPTSLTVYDDEEDFCIGGNYDVVVRKDGYKTELISEGDFLPYIVYQEDGVNVKLLIPTKWYYDNQNTFIEDYDASSAYPTVKRVSFRKATQTKQEFIAELGNTEEGYQPYEMAQPITGTTEQGFEYEGYYKDETVLKGLRERRYLFYISNGFDAYVLEVRQHLDFDGDDFVNGILESILQSFEVKRVWVSQNHAILFGVGMSADDLPDIIWDDAWCSLETGVALKKFFPEYGYEVTLKMACEAGSIPNEENTADEWAKWREDFLHNPHGIVAEIRMSHLSTET